MNPETPEPSNPEPGWEDAFMRAHSEHVGNIINHAIQRLSIEKQHAIMHGLESKLAEIYVTTTMENITVVIYHRLDTGAEVPLWAWPKGGAKPMQFVTEEL